MCYRLGGCCVDTLSEIVSTHHLVIVIIEGLEPGFCMCTLLWFQKKKKSSPSDFFEIVDGDNVLYSYFVPRQP